jgi:hypothetical protein
MASWHRLLGGLLGLVSESGRLRQGAGGHLNTRYSCPSLIKRFPLWKDVRRSSSMRRVVSCASWGSLDETFIRLEY